MATERELKTQQEGTLYDILMTLKMTDDKTDPALVRQLKMIFERAQSGMTADEIDAVRERVARTLQ